MRHHTKDKGDLGVLKAQADLAEKGWIILIPLSEHTPFDLCIYKEDVGFKTVQVKYRSVSNGAVRLKMRSVWSDKHGIHEKPTDFSSIDLVCIYCPELNQCAYVNPSDLTDGNRICLRVETSKNNQKKNVKMFSDYLQVP